ncbi:MAG: 2-hydroxycarboxylate transporter family protein [Synergistaceae bacterium]|nr:2-hydroxycarboxylate transporter family protein [Synergistaceae bacterium]
MSDKKGFMIGSLPWWQALLFIVLCAVPMYLGIQSKSMTGTFCSIFALAVVFNEIGERLPIWNDYIGGGLLMCFFGVALLKHYGLIPEQAIKNINSLVSDDANYLEFFIVMLITGSVLSLDRDILLRSFLGYIPAILGGLAVAMLFGVVVAALFGVSPSNAIIKYVLPVMGGGNGGGAVPLSDIYQTVTGQPRQEYYGFAIIILTIANVFCIIASALLNKLGDKVPILTGDKSTLIRGGKNLTRDDEKVKTNVQDMVSALLVAFASYSVGRLMSRKLLPTIFGASIHAYAYMIIFVVILAASGKIPDNVRAGAKRLQSFVSSGTAIAVMVGMGTDFEISELFTVLNFSNAVIALAVVIGAIIGSAVVGYLVGFYPIDSALTAGLCMANRGGNGDIACLGAAKRMNLIAYAQLSSRLGGGMVLVIASLLFSFLLK